jgi:hypothetical protein
MDNVREILDRIGVFRHPCDVDLLVFFARHPRTLMPSEQLASFLGYEQAQVAESLDVLIEAKFLERTPNSTHPARLYVFAVNGPSGGWLPALLRHAATRDGRLAIRRALTPEGSTGRAKAGPRPVEAPAIECWSCADRGERADG